MKKIISIATSCCNEIDNIPILYLEIVKIFEKLIEYDFEIVISDNGSTDGTIDELKKIAAKDKRFKVLINQLNYGPTRAPLNSMLHCNGEVVIGMASDLEDSPDVIPHLIKKWEEGFKLVVAVRQSSSEKGFNKYLRSTYYVIMGMITDTSHIKNYTGFGLYDTKIIRQIINLDDHNLYFRGLIPNLGIPVAQVKFHKSFRAFGESKATFISNYDHALQGIIRSSRFPLRFTFLLGVFMTLLTVMLAGYFLFEKIIYWNDYQAGMIPLILTNLLLFGILFLILGLQGEYISLISDQVSKKFPVIVKEKINFDI